MGNGVFLKMIGCCNKENNIEKAEIYVIKTIPENNQYIDKNNSHIIKKKETHNKNEKMIPTKSRLSSGSVSLVKTKQVYMILGVEEFEPSEAFPIANFLILLCGLITFTSFAMDKYEHPKNIFVNYDIAVVFGPSMLLGAKFGTILNRMLSSTVLLIFLLFLLIYTCSKTYKNIKKAKAAEEKLLEKGPLKEPLLDKEEEKKEEENNLENLSEDEKERREFLREEEDPLNWKSINFLLFMELIVIIDQFIEGSNKVPSFIGIQRCSLWYWISFGVYILITLIFVKLAISYILVKVRRKKELLPDYKSEVMENVENRLAYVVSIGIFAGIVSSSLGIGGGMITNPVFFGLGMDSKQSSCTSNFLIIVTAIASSFIFVLSGQLIIL